MNWPQTLEIVRTASADMTAFRNAFITPVYTVYKNFMYMAELWTEVFFWLFGWEAYQLTTSSWNFMTMSLSVLFNCDESEVWGQFFDWIMLTTGLFMIFSV